MQSNALIAVLGFAVVSCSSSDDAAQGAAGAPGSDASVESGSDASSDGGPDASSDAPSDAPPDVQADAADSMADTAVDAPEPPSSFVDQGRELEPCPLSALLCNGWPGDDDGPVYVYRSTQVWKGQSFDRTFHVHVPANMTGPAPLVVVLHGGGSSGAQMLAVSNWDNIGDPRGLDGITWRKNTDDCRAEPTDKLVASYVDGSGDACLPPPVTVTNALPFVSVFPDGVLDDGVTSPDGARHWEDGRVPSPGFGTDEEQRDDVGFIDHVIDRLLDDPDVDIDASAVYVVGGSNGGMMTQRVLCHVGDARFPSLSRVAAFQATIAELPEGLLEGQHGREACPSVVGGDVPLQIVLGTDIDTPDCESYPCSAPVVAGDGLMPFGEAGGRHNVYSPDLGTVIAGPDTIAFWQAAFAARQGAPDTTVDDTVGYFTSRSTTTFSGSVARLEIWVTPGGGHVMGATRMDFTPVGAGWAFVSSFRRDATGALSTVDPTWISGPY